MDYPSVLSLEVGNAGCEFSVESVDDSFLRSLGGCCLGQHQGGTIDGRDVDEEEVPGSCRARRCLELWY